MRMIRIAAPLTALVLAVVVTACAPPPAADSAEIRARSERWLAAFQDGDVDALLALYADDARVLAPGAPMASGREAVRATFVEMIGAGLSGEVETVEAMAAGDLGYHIGTYRMTVGGEAVDEGKFIEIWRLRDGEWLIVADMFSSDLPAVAPADDDAG